MLTVLNFSDITADSAELSLGNFGTTTNSEAQDYITTASGSIVHDTDCAGNYYGDTTIDDCGVCGGGNADQDDCGVCDGGNQDQDCAGVCFGDSALDDCGVCDGGNADQDCAGVCFGDSILFVPVDCLSYAFGKWCIWSPLEVVGGFGWIEQD